jgi:hypothetical protein
MDPIDHEEETSMEAPDPVPTTPCRPLSVSQVRTYLTCGNAYRLRYLDGHLPRPGSGLWYGSLMHTLVQRAYGGSSLAEAHATTWAEACGPALPLLARWLALDEQYAASGRPATKAAREWRAAHPEYDDLRSQIEAYQQTALAHVRWGERTTLSHYYRRSASILSLARGELLLDRPLLVEGRPPEAEEGEECDTAAVRLSPAPSESAACLAGEEDDGERGRDYSLLFGYLGDRPVVGVPDVVAFDGRTYSVADYKFWTGRPLTPEKLAVDGQLVLYYHLLVQNGVVDPAMPVRLGHIYPQDDGTVVQVWSDASRYREVLALLTQQFSHVAGQIESSLFIPVHGILSPFMSPCGFCDMAHVCRAMLGGEASG